MARAMKNSGIKWVGEIPEGWKVSRVGLHFDIILGKMLCATPPSDDYTLESYFCAANIHFDGTQIEGLKQMWFSPAEKEQYRVKEGDLLVVEGGAGAGGCAIVVKLFEPIYIQNSVMIVRSRAKQSCRFLQYYVEYLVKSGYIDVACNKATIPHFTKDKLSNVPFPIFEGQESIADYLDSECAKITAVIEQTRASIEEYKKLKQSVITQAVTKGIRPGRKMKDSGVEWIGEIPEDWRFTKTLNCLSMPITDGPHTTPELFDEGIAFISAEAVSCGNGRIDFSHKRGYISQEFYEECCKKYIPEIDDIYMIKSGATTGRVSIVDTLEPTFTIWSPLAVFRCNREMMAPRFLYYALQSKGFQKQVEFGWTFGTQQNIGMRALEQLKVCAPQAEEQKEIVEYLDKKCAEIDSLIHKKQQFLTELESYKKSLIFEYVTGKKEVPV